MLWKSLNLLWKRNIAYNMESDEPNDAEHVDALLQKVDDVLDTIQPIYKSEKFDSLKQVI